jgi:hypothetical protein
LKEGNIGTVYLFIIIALPSSSSVPSVFPANGNGNGAEGAPATPATFSLQYTIYTNNSLEQAIPSFTNWCSSEITFELEFPLNLYPLWFNQILLSIPYRLRR